MRINPTSGRNSNDQILDFIRAIASARNQGQVKTIITTVPVLATLGTGGFLKGNVLAALLQVGRRLAGN
jgi:hypothetical protein